MGRDGIWKNWKFGKTCIGAGFSKLILKTQIVSIS